MYLFAPWCVLLPGTTVSRQKVASSNPTIAELISYLGLLAGPLTPVPPGTLILF